MFLVAFYGLFCLGELTDKSTQFVPPVVQYCNLTFLSHDGHIHTAKITISEYKQNTSYHLFDILILFPHWSMSQGNHVTYACAPLRSVACLPQSIWT